MRIAPALGITALILISAAVGCRSRVSGGEHSPRAEVRVLGERNVGATVDSGVAPMHVRRPSIPAGVASGGDGHAVSVGSYSASASARIAERIDASRSEWERHCAEMESARLPKTSVSTGEDAVETDPTVPQVPASVLKVGRKYAADSFNSRLRISLLKTRLSDADPAEKPALLRKLEQEEARLSEIDQAYSKEIQAEE